MLTHLQSDIERVLGPEVCQQRQDLKSRITSGRARGCRAALDHRCQVDVLHTTTVFDFFHRSSVALLAAREVASTCDTAGKRCDSLPVQSFQGLRWPSAKGR